MTPFDYRRATGADDAVRTIAANPADRYLGGGTNLVDLMREGIERPERLIDVTGLDAGIAERPDGSLLIGAATRNTALAEHRLVRDRYPMLARAILSASRPDDLVLDPFCGTGTTGAVARRLGRRFIGFERETSYAKSAEKRIAEIEPLEAPTLVPFMTARDAPRVPFQALLDRGLVSAGAKLVDAKKKHKALVRADGAISLGDNVGSIHRIGALAQGLEACNGWTFWHVETPKGLTLIDELRAKVRAEMDA